MKIGLIGTGAIGTFLLHAVNEQRRIPTARITAIHSRRYEQTQRLAQKYNTEAYETVEQILQSDVDVIIEAATGDVVKMIAEEVFQHKKHLIVSSIGAFVDETYLHKIETIASRAQRHLYFPSGAIGGLDVIRAAKTSNTLQRVALTTRKPPIALQGEIKEATVLFQGQAKEAITQFPQNMNVAIALSLAGLGVEQTEVCVISDPTVTKNHHKIEAYGLFGTMTFEIENNPLPSNPKTSALAAYSLLATIQSMTSTVVVGS